MVGKPLLTAASTARTGSPGTQVSSGGRPGRDSSSPLATSRMISAVAPRDSAKPARNPGGR